MPEPVPAPTAPAAAPAAPELVIRPARLRDVGPVTSMYLARSAASRELYHPFPESRVRLFAIFGYMAMTQRRLPWLLRRRRLRAAVLLVARRTDTGALLGYGNVGFERSPDGTPRAIFGYLVEEEYRGRGIGTRLHDAMIESALALGVKRGGGMVVVQNTANVRVLAKLGFELSPTDVVDRGAPDSGNLRSDGDLEEIARRRGLRTG